MKHTHSGKYNLLMTYLLQAANFLFPLISFPYVSRILGADGLGRISFANSVSAYFAALATFGITSYAVRTCARLRSDQKALVTVAGELLTANCVTTLLSMALFALTIWLVPAFRAQLPYMLLFGLAFATDFLGISWFYTSMERFDYVTVRTVALKCLSLFLIFLLIRSSSDVMTYAIILVGATVGANLLNFFYARRLIGQPLQFQRGFVHHYTATKWFFVQSVALTLFSNMDVTMMGFVSSLEQVGNYEVALKLKLLLTSLVSSLGNVFLPRLSRHYQENKMDAYWDTVHKSLRFVCFLSLPMIAFFWMFAGDVILLFCGAKYPYAGAILQVLMVAVLPIGLSTVTGIQVLLSMGKEKSLLLSLVLGSALNFFLNLLLIPRYHGVGAACATLCAEILVLLVQLFCLRGMRLSLLSFLAKPFAGAALATGGVLLLGQFLTVGLFSTLLISGLLFAALYFGLLFLWKEPISREIMTILLKRDRNHESE